MGDVRLEAIAWAAGCRSSGCSRTRVRDTPGGSLSVIDLLVAIAFGRFAPRSLQVYDA